MRSQNLHGETIVIHEPYAVLMHHMSDLEDFMKRISTQAELLEQDTHTVQRDCLEILLNFVRPKFQQWCEPAQKRLLQAIPTVSFDELWFLMRPGSMAYTNRGGHWIGCAIVESSMERSPEDQSGSIDDPLRWSVKISLLRASHVSPRLDHVLSVVDIYKFDGQKLVTSLPVFPREFHDKTDAGGRRALFEERGDRISKIVRAGSHYGGHCGYCLNDEGLYVSLNPGRGAEMLTPFTV